MSRGKVKMLSTEQELTAEKCFTEFINQCKARNLSSATIRNYTQQWNYFVKWWGGDSVASIDKDKIMQYIRYLQEKGIRTETINTGLRTIRVLLNYLHEENYIHPIKIKLLKGDLPVKETYTDQELSVMLKKPNIRKCSFREFRTWCMINFLVGTGVRARSLVNIKISDLDLDNSLVKVTVVKNRKQQILPLPPSLITILNMYLKHRGGEQSDYLFCNEKNCKMRETSVYHDVQFFNEARGITQNGLHKFRHSFARSFILSGGDPFRLQRLLGHSTLDMTKRYVQLYDRDMLEGIEKFNLLEKITNSTQKVTMKR
ncbi:tyrosine-type recombinase/integrase [Desulfosporosinus sp. SB140]|uniref:tyrosine-type recombinase/integrase n=1 Tax=Desulfosporosinus paludis TaxID=3115649 RepID=UPI0038906633